MPTPKETERGPRKRVFVLGVSTAFGRAVAVHSALSGKRLIVADEDLSAADRIAEWLKGMGASVVVESERVDRDVMTSIGTAIDCVVDARTTSRTLGASTLDVAYICGDVLPRCAMYARPYFTELDDEVIHHLPTIAKSAEKRGSGFVALELGVRAASDTKDLAIRVLLAAMSGPHTGLLDIRLMGSGEHCSGCPGQDLL